MPIKVKVYAIPNPQYRSNEPEMEQKFKDAVDALAESIGSEVADDGWEITKIAGGDSVLVVIFEK